VICKGTSLAVYSFALERIEATVPEKLVRQTEAIKLQQTWCILLVIAQRAMFGAIAAAVGYKTPCRGAAIILLIGVCFSSLSIIAASVLASAHSLNAAENCRN
jgi:hypothetical protein